MSHIESVPEPDEVVTYEDRIWVGLMSQMIFLNWKEIKALTEFLQSADF